MFFETLGFCFVFLTLFVVPDPDVLCNITMWKVDLDSKFFKMRNINVLMQAMHIIPVQHNTNSAFKPSKFKNKIHISYDNKNIFLCQN